VSFGAFFAYVEWCLHSASRKLRLGCSITSGRPAAGIELKGSGAPLRVWALVTAVRIFPDLLLASSTSSSGRQAGRSPRRRDHQSRPWSLVLGATSIAHRRTDFSASIAFLRDRGQLHPALPLDPPGMLIYCYRSISPETLASRFGHRGPTKHGSSEGSRCQKNLIDLVRPWPCFLLSPLHLSASAKASLPVSSKASMQSTSTFGRTSAHNGDVKATTSASQELFVKLARSSHQLGRVQVSKEELPDPYLQQLSFVDRSSGTSAYSYLAQESFFESHDFDFSSTDTPLDVARQVQQAFGHLPLAFCPTNLAKFESLSTSTSRFVLVVCLQCPTLARPFHPLAKKSKLATSAFVHELKGLVEELGGDFIVIVRLLLRSEQLLIRR
jgi:hypothetical protein